MKKRNKNGMSKLRTAMCLFMFLAVAFAVVSLCTWNTVREDGTYHGKEEVALYIYTYAKLPSNFVNKAEAGNLSLTEIDGINVGGNEFQNREQLIENPDNLPMTECDIYSAGYNVKNRGAERLVFFNDGSAVFYTPDHYATFRLVTMWDINGTCYIFAILSVACVLGEIVVCLIVVKEKRNLGEELSLSLQIVVASTVILAFSPFVLVLLPVQAVVEYFGRGKVAEITK